MITFNFSHYPLTGRLIVPIDGVTLIANTDCINAQTPMLLDMYYTFYGLLNYDKICSEILLSEIAEMESSPLDFDTAESLKTSLPKLTLGQEKYLSEIFDSHRIRMQHRDGHSLACIVRNKFGLSHNPVSGAEIIEEGKAILRQETRSGSEEPTTINSIVYLDGKNPRIREELQSKFALNGGSQADVESLLNAIQPYAEHEANTGRSQIFGYLQTLLQYKQLDKMTLLLIDNLDYNMSHQDASVIEWLLIETHKATGCRIVVTGHETINLCSGWNIQGYSRNSPFCVILRK